MIITPSAKSLRIHHLMPPLKRDSDGSRNIEHILVGPTIADPEIIKKKLLKIPDTPEDIDSLIDIGPCSADIKLTTFFNSRYEQLTFPFTIKPGEWVIGRSGLTIFNDQDHMYCVETRSKTARKGLACTGFLTWKNKWFDFAPGVEFFEEENFALDFAIQNYNSNKFIIREPFLPIQITATSRAKTDVTQTPFRLYRAGKDVTEECRVEIGRFVAYKVHICDELLVPKTIATHIDIADNNIDAQFERQNISEIQNINPDFCLTITDEEIYTNGCPAYMFPFHYMDAIENPEAFITKQTYSGFVRNIFTTTQGLPVTGNAGMINTSCKGRIVCENITQGRDLKKYFNKGEPFALVIPVPFQNNKIHETNSEGIHDKQQTITF